MFEIDQIFVPVDFSRSARASLEIARQLPGPQQSSPKLHLAHVLPRLGGSVHRALFPYAAMGEDEAELEVEMIASTQRELQERLELDPEKGRPRHELTCEVGTPKELLPKMLLRSPSDLVVMGAFGEGGALPEALGSTAARMLRTSSCPVLLTRDVDRKPKLARILCPLDLSAQSTHVLKVALSLALSLDIDFHALFVLPDPLAEDPHNLISSQIKSSHEQLLEQSRHKIEALFERTFKSLDLPFPLRDRAAALWRQRKACVGHIASTIVQQADELDADLIVMGARNLYATHSSQLGRTCWEVTRRSVSHTLIVPAIHESTLLSPNE